MSSKKAQASLEMVIGLVILLVVAGVVISLVLFFMKPEQVESITGGIEWKKFVEDCKQKCEAKQYADYCSSYWSGDYNKNKLYPELIRVGEYNWYACEDRIYCFLVAPCEDLGRGIEVIRNCGSILCQYYTDKGYEQDDLSSQLSNDIKISEKVSCETRYENEATDVENWIAGLYEGCGFEGGLSAGVGGLGGGSSGGGSSGGSSSGGGPGPFPSNQT